ncbi:oligosaccharide flippase family protein [Fervidicoccus fontis]|uniref:Oligosaccharide flippase family protein n=1 Tax=Fervidicoccus fontis TaxID=683846 RepID=A0A843AHN6_9CREN|nr:oligosaccharide flippase family protein [Fervidicoccus fontis]MBE9391089.1 oligosaccharide flippase family protein [Fervidicoccus fontis]
MSRESHVGKVISSGFWLYLSTIISNLQGFFYWLIISRIAGGSVVGTVSAIVGLSSLISGLISLGITTGLSRYTGLCIGIKKSNECASEYLWTSVYFSLLIYIIGGILVFIYSKFFGGAGSYSTEELTIAALLVFVGFAGSFTSFLQSLLLTKYIFISVVAAAIFKFTLGVLLVYFGYGWVGAALGYFVSTVVQFVINSYHSLKITGFKIYFNKDKLKELLRAGIPSWLPGVISTIGQWFGVILLYGTIGSLETGSYFIASQLANVVLNISNILNGLLLPVLSGLSDGRKRVGSRVFRISLALMLPVSFYIMVYPTLLLDIFGKELSSGSIPLVILLFGSIPVAFSGFVSSLVYAYGDYLTILKSGLITNVPRVILYFILVPKMSGIGAAISFTTGSYLGALYLLYIAYKLQVQFKKKEIAILISVPLIFSVLLFFVRLSWYLGMLIMASSYLIYIKEKIVTKEDLKEISRALLGEERTSLLYQKMRPILEPLFE